MITCTTVTAIEEIADIGGKFQLEINAQMQTEKKNVLKEII